MKYYKHIGHSQYALVEMSQQVYDVYLAVIKYQWIPVSSSNLSKIRYDRMERILEVKFVGGNQYMYFDVPDYEITELLAASSKGSFFYWNIRTDYDYYKQR